MLIFSLHGKDCLIIVDYYSKYPEVCLLKQKSASFVIDKVREMFVSQQIAEVIMANSMPC